MAIDADLADAAAALAANDRRIAELEAELARESFWARQRGDLLARVESKLDRLPKLKDGSPAIPGDFVLCPNGHRKQLAGPQKRVGCDDGDCYRTDQGDKGPTSYSLSECLPASAPPPAAATPDEQGKDGAR